MVGHEVALEYPAIFPGCQSMEDLAESRPYLSIEHFLFHLGDKDEMILTVPLGMLRMCAIVGGNGW
jgi:hypothetical protein